MSRATLGFSVRISAFATSLDHPPRESAHPSRTAGRQALAFAPDGVEHARSGAHRQPLGRTRVARCAGPLHPALPGGPMSADAQPITGLTPDSIAPHVFLCGDPARVPRIAKGWDEVREVCRRREYLVVTGRAGGVPLSAASTGIGGPGTAILME